MCSNDNSCIADAFCVHVRLTEAIGHQEMLQVNVTSLRAQTGPVPTSQAPIGVKYALLVGCPYKDRICKL